MSVISEKRRKIPVEEEVTTIFDSSDVNMNSFNSLRLQSIENAPRI